MTDKKIKEVCKQIIDISKITSIEYNKKDLEPIRQEKNRILINREVYSCFSYAMTELYEKELINFEDIENLYYTDEQIKENYQYDLKGLNEEETEEFIKNIRDRGEDIQEIYEYWIVSEWFFDKLKELKEPIVEWGGLYIWGRTTTGQSIALDYIIDKIRRSLN